MNYPLPPDPYRDDARRALFAALAQLPRDRRYQVSVEEWQAKRGARANRFYWGAIVNTIADFCGHSPTWVHEYLKSEFCPRKTHDVLGREVTTQSTTLLSSAEFAAYCDQCAAWAADELALPIPDRRAA